MQTNQNNINLITKTIMKKQILAGGGRTYYAPAMKQLDIRCESGFAASVEIEGLTPSDGEWDD